jgi:hypothetical protein
MTATVTELKTGLKTRLDTITNLRAYAVQPDQVNPSLGGIAWPTLESVTYHGAMGPGLVTHVFTVSVIHPLRGQGQASLHQQLRHDHKE